MAVDESDVENGEDGAVTIELEGASPEDEDENEDDALRRTATVESPAVR